MDFTYEVPRSLAEAIYCVDECFAYLLSSAGKMFLPNVTVLEHQDDFNQMVSAVKNMHTYLRWVEMYANKRDKQADESEVKE